MRNSIELEENTQLIELNDNLIQQLSELVTSWQKNPDFIKYLKEQPMDTKQNLRFLQDNFHDPQALIRGIKCNGKFNRLIGFVLLHCFNLEENSLEISFRMDPAFQSKGICTQAVKHSLKEVLRNGKADKVVGRHSCYNKGSFHVFRKSGFRLKQFAEQQTFLPNLNTITDDFKWEITNILENGENPDENTGNKPENISLGLKKHGFSK